MVVSSAACISVFAACQLRARTDTRLEDIAKVLSNVKNSRHWSELKVVKWDLKPTMRSVNELENRVG